MSISTEITRLQNVRNNIRTSIINKDVIVPIEAKYADIPAYIDLIKTYSDFDDGWVRPDDWLIINGLAILGEQKIVGLFAVYPNNTPLGYTNTVAFIFQGNYTVNWGDGNTSNHNSNTIAEHLYDYDAILSNTECSRGYRQVIITITPQQGQNITTFNLSSKSTLTTFNYIVGQWLDIHVSGTVLSSCAIGSQNAMLEHIKFMQSNQVANLSYNVSSLYNLQSLDFSQLNTNGGINMQASISYCSKIRYVDLSNFKLTNLRQTFIGCSSLVTVKFTNATLSGNNYFAQTFFDCKSMRFVDLSSLTTTQIVYFDGLFGGCSSIEYIDISNFSIVNAGYMGSMFSSCINLKLVIFGNTVNNNAIIMQQVFQNCPMLQKIDFKNIDMSKVTNMSYMFNNCPRLQEIDFSNTNLGLVSNINTTFTGLGSLIKCRLPQFNLSFSIANNRLDANNLNLLFGDLKDRTGLSALTITITGNPGATTCDRTIATNKNWIVTG